MDQKCDLSPRTYEWVVPGMTYGVSSIQLCQDQVNPFRTAVPYVGTNHSNFK